MAMMITDKHVAASADETLREAACERLRADRRTGLAQIEVQVHRRVVTLSGKVRKHDVRRAAERVVLSTPGLRALINDVEVVPRLGDRALAGLVGDVLRWDAPIPLPSRIKVQVKDGHVILTGTVDLQLQQVLAETLISQLGAVRSVTNHLRVGR